MIKSLKVWIRSWWYTPTKISIAQNLSVYDGKVNYNNWYVVWHCGSGQYGSEVIGGTPEQAYLSLTQQLTEFKWPPFSTVRILGYDATN